MVQDDEFRGLRSGRRAEGRGQLASKVHRHQRVAELATCVPDIPDISEAKRLVQRGGM